jgi:hypothetical protein
MTMHWGALHPEYEAPRRRYQTERGVTNFVNSNSATETTPPAPRKRVGSSACTGCAPTAGCLRCVIQKFGSLSLSNSTPRNGMPPSGWACWASTTGRPSLVTRCSGKILRLADHQRRSRQIAAAACLSSQDSPLLCLNSTRASSFSARRNSSTRVRHVRSLLGNRQSELRKCDLHLRSGVLVSRCIQPCYRAAAARSLSWADAAGAPLQKAAQSLMSSRRFSRKSVRR